jgi:alpha-tubulin suppressor-like RCC1 family protein
MILKFISATLALTFGIALFATSVDAAPSTATYEWGQPVASGGPGLSPSAVSMKGEDAIDAGNSSDLAIMPGGTVEAWGDTVVAKSSMTPVKVPELKNVVQVADGDHDFVALEAPTGIEPGACPTNTSVWTWGDNINGDLGMGSTTSATYKTPVDLKTLNGLGVVQVVDASWHMLALTCSGQVYVWGTNSSDDLGMGSVGKQPTPIKNPYLTALTKGTSKGVMLDTGSFAADILVNGKAYGWGNNKQLECGCNSKADSVPYPTAVTQTATFTFIDSGGDFDYDGHTLATDSSGRVWCWGNNNSGQCGLGTSANVGVPTLVPGLPKITTVRAGGQQSLYLDTNGNVWTSGSNQYGQAGDGSKDNEYRVVKVLSHMTMISAGANHSLATN